MVERPMTVAIGIDVGGTDIKCGLVRSDGQLLDRETIATETKGGVDHVIDRMIGLVERLRRRASARSLTADAVGLGLPGTLSRRRGMVIAPPNLEGWRNVPIVERLRSATGLRVVLDNDANNAALGEHRCGAGRGVRDMVMLTLGTGIGGGIILDGKLWHGAGENAGELGHSIVHVGGRRCQCGQHGCLEAYASAGGTAARAAERVAAGETSSLKQIVDRGGTIEADDVVAAAAEGDTLAVQVWNETCRYLAAGCLSIQRMMDPDCIVLGGGMSAAGERLHGPLVGALQEMSSKTFGTVPDVRIATLGNDAGLIGSALSVFR